MKWIKLYTDNYSREFEQNLIKNGGLEAYGFYIILLQKCAEKVNNKTKNSDFFEIEIDNLKNTLGVYHKKKVLNLIKITNKSWKDTPPISKDTPLISYLDSGGISKDSAIIFVESFSQVVDFTRFRSGEERDCIRNVFKEVQTKEKMLSARMIDPGLGDSVDLAAKQPGGGEKATAENLDNLVEPGVDDEFAKILSNYKIRDFLIKSNKEKIFDHFGDLERFKLFLNEVISKEKFKKIEENSLLLADYYLAGAIKNQVGIR